MAACRWPCCGLQPPSLLTSFPGSQRASLAATPGRHWLEYVDWAVPLLQEPLQIAGGMAIVPNRAGNGMLWDEGAVAKFKLD